MYVWKISRKEEFINAFSFDSFMRLNMVSLLHLSSAESSNLAVTYTYVDTYVLDVNSYVFTQMWDPSGCDIGT